MQTYLPAGFEGHNLRVFNFPFS